MNRFNILNHLLLFTFFLSSFSVCFSQESDKNEFTILSKVYEVNKEPSDYIIVIDRSGTVKKFWNPIKKAVIQIVDLAKEGDYVSFFGFDGSADNLILPRTISSQNLGETKNEINGLKEPKGAYTDLFESVDFTLEKGINRPEGNKIQLIFYFTDFKNEPPLYSRWKNISTDTLVNKRINYIEKSGKLVNVFAFQLPLDAGAGRDFEEFSHVFDNRVKRIISDLNAMQNWFGRLSQEIYREKLKLLLQNDLNDFLLINSLKITGNIINVEVVNKLGLPVTIDRIDIESKESGLLTKQLFTDVKIPEKGTANLSVPISEYLKGYESFLEKSICIENPLVTFHYSFPEIGNELAILNIPSEQVKAIQYDNELVTKIGLRYWIAGVIVLLLSLLMYLIYKIWLKSEWIFKGKSFKVNVSLDDNLMIKSSKKIFLPTRKAIEIDNTIICPDDIPAGKEKIVANMKFKIYLDPAKPGFFSRYPERGTYISAECASGRFKIKKIQKGKETFISLPSNRVLFTQQVSLHSGIKIIGEITSGITITRLVFNFLPN